MRHNTSTGICEAKQYKTIQGIIHGFTTRTIGDMNVSVHAQAQALEQLGCHDRTLIYVEQIHGNTVISLTAKEFESIGLRTRMGNAYVFPRCDGCVLKRCNAAENFVFGVRGADCCMILLVDPVHSVIGAVHAGYRGTIDGIVIQAIHSMQSLGSSLSDIHVAIGPYIHACCYTVPVKRAELFRQRFKNIKGTVMKSDHGWTLDIGECNRSLLVEEGVHASHIELSHECTSCDERFFSYRKDVNRPVFEQAALIGFS